MRGWHAIAQPARLTELAHQGTAGGIGIAVVDMQVLRAPRVELALQRAVCVVEQRQVEIGLV
ncbi:hypothetical protein D3C73_1601550 [compost metagenome]